MAYTFINFIRHDKYTLHKVQELFIDMCRASRVYSKKICRALTYQLSPIIFYTVQQRPNVSAYDVCAVMLQMNGNCGLPKGEQYQIHIDIVGDQPQVLGHKNATSPSGKEYKILHITDIHYDPFYKEGATTACNDTECCHANQGPAPSSAEAAGEWGDYRNCDLPWITVKSAIESIATAHRDADFVYLTGDIVDHAVWLTSKQYNELMQKRVLDLFRKEFGKVPVYPVFGNHEPHPVNT